MSDGTLINWLKDGRIGQFDVVMIDEAHEQSENMEQIFALLKARLPLYPRMRVVIASATANVDRFRQYFGDGNPNSVFLAAPDNLEGTSHPIEDTALEEWIKCFGSLDEHQDLMAIKDTDDPRVLLQNLSTVVPKVVDAIRTKHSFTN